MNVHHTTYKFGTVNELFGAIIGTSTDWAHGVAGIPYVMGMELRPCGGEPHCTAGTHTPHKRHVPTSTNHAEDQQPALVARSANCDDNRSGKSSNHAMCDPIPNTLRWLFQQRSKRSYDPMANFDLPPDQIIPTGEEVWAFHVAAARLIEKEFST